MSAIRIPAGIHRSDDALTITWADDHVGVYPARVLRLACPCAVCVEELTGRRLVRDDDVPADVRPVSVALVGAYAIRVTWSDGHATGIYTYEMLWLRCPCGGPAHG